jgi:hypothetical protein
LLAKLPRTRTNFFAGSTRASLTLTRNDFVTADKIRASVRAALKADEW